MVYNIHKNLCTKYIIIRHSQDSMYGLQYYFISTRFFVKKYNITQQNKKLSTSLMKWLEILMLRSTKSTSNNILENWFSFAHRCGQKINKNAYLDIQCMRLPQIAIRGCIIHITPTKWMVTRWNTQTTHNFNSPNFEGDKSEGHLETRGREALLFWILIMCGNRYTIASPWPFIIVV